MDKLARGERNRSIRMLLAGGSALATVMVLGTQAANALVATPEELAALNGSSVNTVADGAARTPVAADCGDVAQADGWAAGRYHDLAAVGSADTKGEEEAAPQPSYRQLTLLGEPMSPTTLATAHAAAVGVPSAGEPDPDFVVLEGNAVGDDIAVPFDDHRSIRRIILTPDLLQT